METTLELVEGMQFDRGYLSLYFVTDPNRMEALLEDPMILLHEKKISGMKDFLRLLERVAKQGKPLLVVAEIEGRCNEIHKQIEDTSSEYDREKLQERLAKLAGGVAVQGGRGYRDGDEGAQGPRGGCPSRHPGGRGGWDRLRRRRVALLRAQKVLDGLEEEDRKAGV